MSDTTSLNKLISQAGICSRREADRWIEQGRVYINGTVAQKGARVKSSDKVKVDGQLIKTNKSTKGKVYIAVYKPEGIECTTDADTRNNIVDFINHNKRIFPIGRLDKASTGLILMTNDGDIVNQILRKEHQHEKEYIVTVNKPITNEFLNGMRNGVPILGQRTDKCRVDQLKEHMFRIVLTQGLNRQIRRMCQHFGYHVRSLKRIRIMHIKVDGLRPGQWRNLSSEELQELRQRVQKG